MGNYDFLDASDGTGDAALMHITATRLTGATTIQVDSVNNVPAKFIGTYGTLLATGFIDPATKVDFLGHVSGSNLEIDSIEPGSTDAGNVAGQVVLIKPNTGWADRVARFIQNATGLGTPENLTANGITVNGPASFLGTFNAVDGSINGSKLAASTVTPDKMQGIDLLGVGPALDGAAPSAGTGQFYQQCGTYVGTSPTIPISFPVAFPNGVVSVVCVEGDATNGAPVRSTSVTKTGFIANFSSSVVVGSRINWIAIGF